MNAKGLAALSKPVQPIAGYSTFAFGNQKPTATDLRGYITKIQFQRMAADVMDWREAMFEMEDPWFPHRVKANRIYIDTIENIYVKSLLDKWRELTLQRDYLVYQNKGRKREVSWDLTQQLREQGWFQDYLENVLDTILWGYSLVCLGNIDEKNGLFPNLTNMRRENIRPDGYDSSGALLTSIVYNINGIKIQNNADDKLITLANHYFGTKSPRGVSICGYGLLYNIALYEIHLRHVIEWQMDYIELYGQPIRKGSTRKQGNQRRKFEDFLANAGSNKYILLDKATGDEIEYVNQQSAGTAWKVYSQAKKEFQGGLSQLILGHEDAMSTQPGKLGGMQAANKDGFNISIIEQAMMQKQTACGNFLCRQINEISAPKFRELGRFVGSKTLSGLLPEGYYFGLDNDKEEQEVTRRENANRKVISSYIKEFSDGGWKVDDKQLSELTSLSFTSYVPEKGLIEQRSNKTEIIKDEPGTAPTKPILTDTNTKTETNTGKD